MKLSAQELSDMVSHRQFQQVVDLWWKGEVAPNDHDALFQVFVAATMIHATELIGDLRLLLPAEMAHDADRDVLLMQIRTGRVTPDLADQVHRLLEEVPKGDEQRKALALMTSARFSRITKSRRSQAFGRRDINKAFGLMIVQEQPDPVWRRNVALWYLIIGSGGMRDKALDFALGDPSRGRRLVARACYFVPSLGRFMPIY